MAGPCVAQRVWLIPQVPGAGSRVEQLLQDPHPAGPLPHDELVASMVARPALS